MSIDSDTRESRKRRMHRGTSMGLATAIEGVKTMIARWDLHGFGQ
jgi:hypothetical protein